MPLYLCHSCDIFARTIVVCLCAVIALAFYGLDRVTFELENPLGWDDNDIDLTGIMHALADETIMMHESVFGPDPPPPPPPALSLLVAN
ncbi:bestrophin family ion channel, partial [Silvimonas sp.]|uniref:bestrophin family ion channel n=1 Tax=Silvimonas sp. TaxID=2650811 RepID=UPI002848B65C